ncbi:MAG: ABC transporter ATP-binding protein [Beijerinckiaceae bacterium]
MAQENMAQENMATNDIILEVKDLVTGFELRSGPFKAVDGVSFNLRKGETLCVVGESGSGKSVTARSILQIVGTPGRIMSGEINYHGPNGVIDIAKLDPRGRDIRRLRGSDIAMIFQEPMTSLSPVHTIGFQIIESIRLHTKATKDEARQRAIALLRRVEIPNPETTIDRYPFEYSGGMRQRAMIAMALACKPKILIADEPTTALDVTTQAEILDLMRELQRQEGMSVLFITHDMGVVAQIADEVAVMHHGKLVEKAPVDKIFHAPEAPYTKMLIGSVLKLESRAEKKAPLLDEAAAMARPKLLEVTGLSKEYITSGSFFRSKATVLKAVDAVDFTLYEGESLGIVGESGSGKTTLGRAIMRIIEPTSGQVKLKRGDGSIVEMSKLDKRALREAYRELRMVFQDPFSSLNPRMTVGEIISEPIRVNKLMDEAAMTARVSDLLTKVGLPASAAERYPHAFSGGQRQRISIARALALKPRLIIADEATSALDVSIRSQILDLLIDLQGEMNLSFIFISHDISVIRYFCDRMAVMYRGKIVEMGPTERVCTRPEHAYTQALLSAVPKPDPRDRTLGDRTRYRGAA